MVARAISLKMADCDDSWKVTRTIGHSYILGSVLMLSIIFNSINVYVFSRRRMRQHKLYLYLLALAISDMSACLVALPFTLFTCYLCSFNNLTYFLVFWTAKIYYPLANAFLAASSWLTVAATAERYRYITSLYHATSYKMRWRTRITVSAIFSLCFVFHIPLVFSLDVVYVYNDNDTTWNREQSEFSKLTIAHIYDWARFVLMQVLPWFCLIIFNFLLLNDLRKRRAQNPPDRRRAYLEGSLTKMVIVLVSAYLLLNVQAGVTTNMTILSVLSGVSVDDILEDPVAQIIAVSGGVIEFTSCCVPFFIYVVFNRAYRRLLWKQIEMIMVKTPFYRHSSRVRPGWVPDEDATVSEAGSLHLTCLRYPRSL